MDKNTWFGCYDDSWKSMIVEEAFAHPAKMAKGLTERIFDYAISKGWIQPGKSTVVDPFGGICSTGIIGASKGVQVVAVELEPRFVELGKANIELHRRTWEAFGDPIPVMLQGDSRKLCEVVRGADCVVGSPPFVESVGSGDAARKILVDNYRTRDTQNTSEEAIKKLEGRFTSDYGQTPGQLGAMKAGSVDSVVRTGLTLTTESTTIDGKETTDDRTTEAGHRTLRDGPKLLAGCSQDGMLHAGSIESAKEGRTQGKGEAKSQNVGCEKGGDRVPVLREGHESETDRAILRVASESDTASDEATGNQNQVQRKAGEETPQLQGRQIVPLVSDSDRQGQMPKVRGDGGSGDSPQERRPLRQPPGKSGSPVQLVPHERDETQVVEGEEGGQADSQKQRSSGVEVVADCILSSPPYEASPITCGNVGNKMMSETWGSGGELNPGDRGYGQTDGNIGNDKGDTFWQAAREIVLQCHQILKPGGVCCWVTKDFVRAKKRVPFSQNWLDLCIACGFEPVEWVKASLVKEERQPSLFGGDEVRTKERKGFFRRLAEAKGSPAIDEEDVIVMRKAELDG